MGTHPIFESDFDCLTEQVKCPSPCWLPDFLLSQNWLPASPSAPCLFRSKTATLTPPPNSSVRVPPPLASPDLEQESELCSALSLLATPATRHRRRSCSLTPSWALPCPRPWDSSASWLPSLSSSLSKSGEPFEKKPRHVPIYLLAVQRCGGVGNVVVTPHQPTLCNNACTSLD